MRMYTYMNVFIYVFIICVCVCVCVCARARAHAGECQKKIKSLVKNVDIFAKCLDGS